MNVTWTGSAEQLNFCNGSYELPARNFYPRCTLMALRRAKPGGPSATDLDEQEIATAVVTIRREFQTIKRTLESLASRVAKLEGSTAVPGAASPAGTPAGAAVSEGDDGWDELTIDRHTSPVQVAASTLHAPIMSTKNIGIKIVLTPTTVRL